MRRIPTLDGWRGVAILLVLANHAAVAIKKTVEISHAPSIGQHGVAIFLFSAAS